MDENDIADFMLKASKFEFCLVNLDTTFALTKKTGVSVLITGINWQKVADYVEKAFPFKTFDFAQSGFEIFVKTKPQCLVVKHNGRPGRDSDDKPIDSWESLLSRSYSQLRNNVAHGNKHQMPAPFSHGRTAQFLPAGVALMHFIADQVFGGAEWNGPIFS